GPPRLRPHWPIRPLRCPHGGSNSRLGTALRRSCEPLVLRIADLTLSRGTKKLLDGVNLTLPVGHKAGLIGANGCGKSTLFAAIRGEIAPDSGAIELPPKWKLAHVAQETPAVEIPATAYVVAVDRQPRD